MTVDVNTSVASGECGALCLGWRLARSIVHEISDAIVMWMTLGWGPGSLFCDGWVDVESIDAKRDIATSRRHDIGPEAIQTTQDGRHGSLATLHLS